MTEEQKLQTKIINLLEADGWIVVKTIALSKSGYPDIFAFRNKEAIFIEVKKKGGVRSPIQEYRINELQKQGFMAEFIDDIAVFRDKFL